jgi:hypothetical protein
MPEPPASGDPRQRARHALRTLADHGIRVGVRAGQTVIGGTTYPLRDALCACGFRWEARTKCWAARRTIDLLALLPALATELLGIEATSERRYTAPVSGSSVVGAS